MPDGYGFVGVLEGGKDSVPGVESPPPQTPRLWSLID